MRILQVDPSAFTPPYDHALCAALARAGAQVELATSAFAHGAAPAPDGYVRDERFYRGASSRPAKLARHVPDMLALRAHARAFDVTHFQWLPVQPVDVRLLGRFRGPLVLTAHDVLPREPRPGQLAATRRLLHAVDAVVVHTEHGRARLAELGVEAHVIAHGAFTHLLELEPALPPELPAAGPPVVLFFGLVRPYKGVDVLLRAWQDLDRDAELWVVGAHRTPVPTVGALPDGVRMLDRFVSDEEVAALYRRAAVNVLPYRDSEGSGVLATAQAFGTPLVLSDVGAFAEETSARRVPAGDPDALRGALRAALDTPGAPSAGASWDDIAHAHVALYEELRTGPSGRLRGAPPTVQ